MFCERDPKVPSRLLCQVCISGYYFRSQYAYWGCQVRVCILRLGSDPNMHIGIRVCVLEPGSPNTHIRMRVRILGHFAYWYRHIRIEDLIAPPTGILSTLQVLHVPDGFAQRSQRQLWVNHVYPYVAIPAVCIYPMAEW